MATVGQFVNAPCRACGGKDTLHIGLRCTECGATYELPQGETHTPIIRRRRGVGRPLKIKTPQPQR